MNTFVIKGTSRQNGAIGINEPFEMTIKANSTEEAREGAIYAQHNNGRENVTVDSCEFGGYDHTPMYFNTDRIMDTRDLINAVRESHSPYFFTPDTMRFFKSRLASYIRHVSGGVIFITSEKYDDNSPRLYTVRMFTRDGRINELSEFQEYKTIEAAKRAADRHN